MDKYRARTRGKQQLQGVFGVHKGVVFGVHKKGLFSDIVRGSLWNSALTGYSLPMTGSFLTSMRGSLRDFLDRCREAMRIDAS